MKRIRIKVCGTTRLEDAEAAVDCGVDALGFIFAPKSKRCVSIDVAREIIQKLPPFIDRVGVFVNESAETVAEIVQKCDLSFVQLHGQESVGYCQKLSGKLTGCKLIKAFRVGEHTEKDEFLPYVPFVQAYLLDTYVKGVDGGTGLVFDWSIIKRVQLDKPLILAGGLTPDNITDLLQTMVPYAVDINSGVEDSPGLKNYQKLAAIIENIRAFERDFPR